MDELSADKLIEVLKEIRDIMQLGLDIQRQAVIKMHGNLQDMADYCKELEGSNG